MMEGDDMTEKNRKLREEIKEIERLATGCLNGQPHDDDECERHLKKVLTKIANKVCQYQGLAEIEAYNIKWDTDGEDVCLPDTVRVFMNPEDVGDRIVDFLSDDYGWLVNSLEWRIVWQDA
jgi:hypothetical protein